MDEVASKAIARSKQDEAPADYLLKIDSFTELCSVLKNAKVSKFESSEFETGKCKAGKCKWRLELHPNGDSEMNEKAHVSLYLAMADVKAIPPKGYVSAVFKLFVFDQIRDKYLVIHDGRVRRFNAAKTKYGFHQLLPLATFKDPANGYLVGNCCVFGAEVHVIKDKSLSTVERHKLSFENNEKKPRDGIFTFKWELENFSTLDNECYHSRVFTACQHKWTLQLYPKKEVDEAKGPYLSLFLCLEDGNNLEGEKLYLQFDLSIKDQWAETNLERQVFYTWIDGDSRKKWGEEKFIPLSCIKKWYNGLIMMDSVISEVKIIQCSRIESFS